MEGTTTRFAIRFGRRGLFYGFLIFAPLIFCFITMTSAARASCDADPYFAGVHKGLTATQSKPESKSDFERQMVLLRRVATNLKDAKETGDVECRAVSNDEMISWDDRIAASKMAVYIIQQNEVYHAWLVANTVQTLLFPEAQHGSGCRSFTLALSRSDIAKSWSSLAQAMTPASTEIAAPKDVDLAKRALEKVAGTLGMALPDMELGTAALEAYGKKYATQEAEVGATAPTDCVASDYDWL